MRCWWGCLAAVAVLVSAACRGSAPPDPHAITVSVSSRGIAAPDTARAGWTRLRVEENRGGHVVVVFRIPADLSPEGVQAFLAAMDTAAMTPSVATALGGPEVDNAGEVFLDLAAGRYLLGCVSRGDDGHRHLAGDEWKVMEVVAGDGMGTAPVATHVVRMGDFAFGGAAAWSAGEQVLQVVNGGRQDHQMRIDRLHPGISLQAWLAAPENASVSTPVAGAARMGPGQIVYLPVALERGEYVLYCLVPDTASGRMHVELGMFRGIKVE